MNELLKLKPDAVQWRQVEDEIVGIDRLASVYFAGNPAAAVLWPLLARGCTRGEMAERLIAEFGIEASRASADAGRFVEALRSRALLV